MRIPGQEHLKTAIIGLFENMLNLFRLGLGGVDRVAIIDNVLNVTRESLGCQLCAGVQALFGVEPAQSGSAKNFLYLFVSIANVVTQ